MVNGWVEEDGFLKEIEKKWLERQEENSGESSDIKDKRRGV